MNEYEKRKRQIFNDIFFEAGAALFDCQTFEYCISYLLYLSARFGNNNLKLNDTIKILEGEEKKTAGQLINLLKKHIRLSEDIEQSLIIALKARNNLVHHYLLENVERMAETNEHKNIIKEIQSLRSNIQKTHKKLQPFVKSLAKMTDGIDINDFEEKIKIKFMSDTQ